MRGATLMQVKPAEFDLKQLESFLADMSVDHSLRAYKGFEVDLRGELNPTELLEQLFWIDKQWLDFPDFADLYWQRYGSALRQRFPRIFESLGEKVQLHLRARLYRTQFGFLTEYHAVILLAEVFTPRGFAVWRGSDLDRVGVDCQIVCQQTSQRYNLHIFVDSSRARRYREKKRVLKSSDQVEGIHVDFPYTLDQGCIHSLRMLPNGFGVYTERYVLHLLELIQRGELQQGVRQEGIDCQDGLIFVSR